MDEEKSEMAALKFTPLPKEGESMIFSDRYDLASNVEIHAPPEGGGKMARCEQHR